ncbi:hypothetical protein BJX70DRAFT_373840 [Aspergillus crustosus]
MVIEWSRPNRIILISASWAAVTIEAIFPLYRETGPWFFVDGWTASFVPKKRITSLIFTACFTIYGKIVAAWSGGISAESAGDNIHLAGVCCGYLTSGRNMKTRGVPCWIAAPNVNPRVGS